MIELMTASSNVAPFEEIISTVNQCVCALNAIEAGKQSAPPCNTASPKLPTLEECIKNVSPTFAIPALKGAFIAGVSNTHDYIRRQLRAGG